MPRHNRIERRAGAKVAVVIDSIEHTLTEPGFIALMEQALNVLQALTAERRRPAPADRREALTAAVNAFLVEQNGGEPLPAFLQIGALTYRSTTRGTVVTVTFEDSGERRYRVDGVTVTELEAVR